MFSGSLPVPHDDGSFISAEVSRVVEAIRDYDPELNVAWIHPDKREPGEAAFAIIHSPKDRPPYVVFYVQDEKDMNAKVLARLYHNDQAKGNTTTEADIEAYDKAKKELIRRQHRDELEAASDLAKHAVKSPLHKYTYRDSNNRKRVIRG